MKMNEIVKKGQEILDKYKQGKANLNKRIVENDKWYKMRHWDVLRTDSDDPMRASAWLFNSIVNKHADAMDNYPQPAFLPREAGDKEDAKILSEIVPVILEQNEFEQVYDSAWWKKLKNGTACYKVYWDSERDNGIGDIGISCVDILNIYWEPGCKDIQDSPHLFHEELVNVEELEAAYPDMKFSGSASQTARYEHDDTIDTTDKTMVVDWYYKKKTETGTVLCYVKFCEGNLLYNSEEAEEGGFYAHGMYPYVFDVMFPEEDSPAGFGYVDIMKDVQMSIDNIWISFEKHVKWAAEPRYFSKDGTGINEDEFSDLTKSIIHYTGSIDGLEPVVTKPVTGILTNLYQMKIDELKETSSNRDFSQGSTASGVTAASAIAALQEAGSKTSRDMIKSAYRSFAKINLLVVELIRQFYDHEREFRIVGERGTDFVKYSNENIKPKPEVIMGQVEVSGRKPIFDIQIKSQKASPFSRAAQNELAKELYGAGLFNPELADQALVCIGMMDFEGKDEIERKISENGTMLQQMQQMQAQIQQMAGALDQITGSNLTEAVGGAPIGGQMPPASGMKKGIDPIGDGNTRTEGIVNRAKEQARERAEVK